MNRSFLSRVYKALCMFLTIYFRRFSQHSQV
ncbi:hypothetical protein SAMN04515675_0998 [Pseudomonas costantinii]|uniref:Uncharacterized protein n=1 Tax=Pseudomonas costantinii TaxID=168469 RepID=A0A1H5ADP2_9PSED|nr:hypothetical protein SAMN04515675_0998 [Pseudomonas costantinii]